jgi:pyruvate,water dikinase
MDSSYVKFLDDITKHDVSFAGGKGANLGEMFRRGLPVPHAFVLTTKAYEEFLDKNNILSLIERKLKDIDFEDVKNLEKKVSEIQELIISSKIPKEIRSEIIRAYRELCVRSGRNNLPVAVRSSATMEDLREASFAGQQLTVLNVRGEKQLISAVKRCWASVYTPRATTYRYRKGFGFKPIPTAVVIQEQIMSEKSGVGFTMHPITGDRQKIVIEAGFGQGEYIVSGSSTPDTYILDKKTGKLVEKKISDKLYMLVASPKGGLKKVKLSKRYRKKQVLEDGEIRDLWRLALSLEKYYNYPQDFEWAIQNGKTYLVQTRAVTVMPKEQETMHVEDTPILTGLGASPGIGTGAVRVILDVGELAKVQKGDILVTRMTTPDFVPAMIKASGIITDEGGMTSHAAIVSRELGVPCIVGTKKATALLNDGIKVTVDGNRGYVFKGELKIKKEREEKIEEIEGIQTRTKVYMNLGVPEKITEYEKIPFDGIGLMRVEFIIASYVGEHPLHLIETGRENMFIEKLSEGISLVARKIYPRPVVVRFSDFKTNEYRELEGGEKFEEIEANPMIGWRGVSRYISEEYRKAFELEVKAIRKVRDEGCSNVWVMLPFVRTTWEVEKCLKILEDYGLIRGKDFKVWIMAEVPSVVFMAEEFAELCDGFSIGSNDLTQLILGIDRDSTRLANLGYFDEKNEAVKRAIKILIDAAHKKGKTISICGQAPSVYPELTKFLVENGIDSVSVNPDTVVKTKKLVHQVEVSLYKKSP